MAGTRKRTIHEVDGHGAESAREPSMLLQIRNMWQFANLFQWIMIFGKALKIDDNIDIEDLEAECLKHGSPVLQDIGLAILKFLSSHRGLTHELFDEYTRRQYLAKSPEKNPFGDEEDPARFADFDVFTKIRILHQMTLFVMMYPEKVREKMEEQKDSEQASWRIEPYGWDEDDRTYYVLDDNRIYRLTEPTPPAPKPKKNSQKARAAARAAKRRRIAAALDSEADESEHPEDSSDVVHKEDDGLGGAKWECVAVGLEEVRSFLGTIRKTRDANEKILRDQIQDHLLPILERQEASRTRKIQQREKELFNLERMAHAKRSSRIASKVEHEKLEEQAREEKRKQRAEEEAERKEEQKRLKMEKERDRRLMSRDNRLREREARRLQHEQELAQLSEDSKNPVTGRLSERRLQAEIEKNKQALKELDDEEDDWIFDCVCGVYGQIDDGTHSVSCEKCNVWQHSKCLGIAEEEAEREDFHFVCGSCRRREQERARPAKIRIKIKGQDASSSPPTPKLISTTPIPPPQIPPHSGLYVAIKPKPTSSPTPAVSQQLNGNAHNLGVTPSITSPSFPSPQKAVPQPVLPKASPANGKTPAGLSKPSTDLSSPTAPSPGSLSNGLAHNPFSSPHPNLSPPDQSPNKSRAYETIFDHSSPAGHPAQGGQAQSSSRPVLNGASLTSVHPSLPPPPASGIMEHVGKMASPSKESPPRPSKGNAAGSSLQQSSPLTANTTSHLKSPNQDGLLPTPSATAVTPRFNPGQSPAGFDRSSPLIPPSRGGLSPTKHSPPLLKASPPGSVNGNQQASTNTILPPVPALSPTPGQQNLTPPVKPQQPNEAAASQAQAQSQTVSG